MKNYFENLGYLLNVETNKFEHSEKPSIVIKKVSSSSAEILISFEKPKEATL